MFIMVLECQGQRLLPINQWGLNQGSALQKAHSIIYLIIWWCVRLLCKQIGMQIAFVCFFPLKAFQADLKHLHPADTHRQTCLHAHARRIMFSGVREVDKLQINVLPPRQGWFSPGCRAACVRRSIRPLVLISPTYITLQINDTAREERSIGDKVKVSPLPAHGAKALDGVWGK